MGRYDFSCNTSAELIESSNSRDVLRIRCYWKNNGWKYHMSPIYGWVTCNGEERLVYNAGYPDFQSDNQAQYELGYSDYALGRAHSGYQVEYHARLRSDSSYASGERVSGSGYHTVGGVTHTVITYNANGGSGAPGNQDKWWGEALYLSNTKPSRTGHTFKCWNTAANGSGTNYNSGDNYTPDPGGTVTLYAQWTANTYAVKYDANGGTGAPAQQTKTYGVNLTLSSTVPTKLDYNFLGWATSSTGAVAYQPGGTYTGNAAVTLYAKWELAYVKPRVTDLNIQRCTSNGTVSESGTYLRTDFKWATDLTGTYAKLQYKESSASSWTTAAIFDNNSNKSGTVSNKVLGGNAISTEKSYIARIYIYDSKGASDDNYKTYSQEFSIGTLKFPMDIKSGGTGVAFGKVAEKADAVDIGFKDLYLLNKKIQDLIYPVGSIYMSMNSTDPSTLFGGTWRRIAKGRCLVGEGVVEANSDNWCGTTNAGDWTAYAGFTGGEVSHKLTVNEMPSHKHTIHGRTDRYQGSGTVFREPYGDTETGGTENNVTTYSSGGNQKHNNLPPYLVVYMWERTA